MTTTNTFKTTLPESSPFASPPTSIPVRIARLRLTSGDRFAREAGRGRPVVFLHGSWSDSSQWLPIIEVIGTTYHCFAPDLPGCGESAPLNAPQSIAAQVDALAEYIDRLRLSEPFYLVGHSLGAWIGTSYVLAHPHRIRGLVAIAPEGIALPAQHERLLAWQRFLAGIPNATRMLRFFKPILPGMAGFAAQVEDWKKRRKHFRASYRLLCKRRRTAIEAERLDSVLANITCPVLAIAGTEDSDLVTTRLRCYAEKIPYLKYVEVDATTDPLVPQNDSISGALRAWFEQTTSIR